jgi:multidrug transporter EmrE-like cation transporter
VGDRHEVHRWLYAPRALGHHDRGDVGYAVWTGIGAVGVAILGMVLFGEPRTWLRIGCILLIVAGIAGLKIVTP